jgi:hypothetical protein
MVDAHDRHASAAADSAPLGPLPNRQSTVVFLVRGAPRTISRQAVADVVLPHAARLYRESVSHTHQRGKTPWVVNFEEVRS